MVALFKICFIVSNTLSKNVCCKYLLYKFIAKLLSQIVNKISTRLSQQSHFDKPAMTNKHFLTKENAINF